MKSLACVQTHPASCLCPLQADDGAAGRWLAACSVPVAPGPGDPSLFRVPSPRPGTEPQTCCGNLRDGRTAWRGPFRVPSFACIFPYSSQLKPRIVPGQPGGLVTVQVRRSRPRRKRSSVPGSPSVLPFTVPVVGTAFAKGFANFHLWWLNEVSSTVCLRTNSVRMDAP